MTPKLLAGAVLVALVSSTAACGGGSEAPENKQESLAESEMALACGIGEILADLDLESPDPDLEGAARDEIANGYLELPIELNLVAAAGIHDARFADAAEQARETYERTLTAWDLEGVDADLAVVRGACGEAESLPDTFQDRAAAYLDFACELAPTLAELELPADPASAEAAEIRALRDIAFAARENPEEASRAEAVAVMASAVLRSESPESFRQSVADVAGACG